MKETKKNRACHTEAVSGLRFSLAASLSLSRPTLCSLGTEISTLLSVIGFCLWIQGLLFAKEKVRMAHDQHYALAYQCKCMIDGEYGLCNGFIRVYFFL